MQRITVVECVDRGDGDGSNVELETKKKFSITSMLEILPER